MPSQHADRLVDLVVLKLASLRIQKSISINKLAWMSGISPKGIALIEQRVNSPTLRNVLRMAEALEVSLGDILTEIETENSG
jgi:transcriptional regulator with XRE-family HTH domain